jgi:hypothetical protein
MTTLWLKKVSATVSSFGNFIDFGGGEAAQHKMCPQGHYLTKR